MPNQAEPRVPVYLINGFLESGKTSFLNFTLSQEYFDTGDRTLIILCEEGEVELDEKRIRKMKADVVTVSSESELTEEFLMVMDAKYSPDRVLIEYNGMWNPLTIQNLKTPSDWVLYQGITTIDASTFNVYLNNMKPLIVAMVNFSDLVIFNRCTKDMPLASYRRSIRATNPGAQIIFENVNGEVEEVPDELPYDLDAPIIDIEDIDYGIFFIDAQDHPERYKGKIVRFLGMAYLSKDFKGDTFVPGRHAMTCCAEDLTFCGYMCHSKYVHNLKSGDWVRVTAQVKYEKVKQYRGVGPVLYAQNIERAEKPEKEVVYF